MKDNIVQKIFQIKKSLATWLGLIIVNYLTASFKALPALKPGTLLAEISISSPV